MLITWDDEAMFSINVVKDETYGLCYNYNSLFYVVVAVCVFLLPVLIAGNYDSFERPSCHISGINEIRSKLKFILKNCCYRIGRNWYA